jgi:hypothetical protein
VDEQRFRPTVQRASKLPKTPELLLREEELLNENNEEDCLDATTLQSGKPEAHNGRTDDCCAPALKPSVFILAATFIESFAPKVTLANA